MTWSHQHDPAGIPDFPEELPFKICIEHYWTNESGARIGYFGRGKGITVFTYKKGNINCRFDVVRDFEGKFVKGREFDGPSCTFYIKYVPPRSLDREDLRDMVNNIEEFLYIFRKPYYPEEGMIERVAPYSPEKYLKSSGEHGDV